MAVRPVHGISVASGIGGLDLALRLAVPGYRTVVYIERDPFAASVICARMADAALDPALVWDEVESFDGRAWRGKIQIVHSGFPCQPWSTAGKRRGTADKERWIWPDIARIIREVEPGFVFLENVPGLVSGGGLGEILGSLAGLRYDARWTTVSAAECGAPHRRKRIFILGRRREMVHTEGDLRRTPGDDGPEPPHRASNLDDVDGPGHEGRGDAAGLAVADELSAVYAGRPLWPPGPSDRDEWARVLALRPELSPATLESDVHGVADGSARRVDRLRALGNAVVPAQAELALRTLLARSGWG